MEIIFSNGKDKAYERKLNRLLKDVFFDFQFWYDLDLWDENYESYSIWDAGEIVSNVCIYKTQLLWNGKRLMALSVGAVATKKEFRNKGLSRRLMERVFDAYRDVPMYLSANDEVVGFYPKFGFVRVVEKLPVCNVEIMNQNQPVRLAYDDPKVGDYVFNRINFSKRLDCLNTASINMFHIHSGYLKDSIYEIPELNTMVIAKQYGPVLKLIGVFSLQKIGYWDLIRKLPFCGVKRVEFGFMPCWTDVEYVMEECDTDPMFVRNSGCDCGDFKFPELSIT